MVGPNCKNNGLLNHPTLHHRHLLRAYSSRTLVAASTINVSDIELDILDRYWEAQGVTDAEQRQRLVDIGQSTITSQTTLLDPSSFTGNISSLTATWVKDAETESQIGELSRRLLELNKALGGKERSVDVVWMVLREPELLLSEPSSIIQRLLELRVSEASGGMDVGKLVEAQPGLLLQQRVAPNGDTTIKEQRQSWEHGLLSDNLTEWQRRLQQLAAYKQQYSDAHVGCRQGDDQELARWATKQRRAYKRNELEEDKVEMLREMGFEFDAERAEWLQFYNELCAFKDIHGHCTPIPLASSTDFMLINWCSVQRISDRSGVLGADRRAMLDSIGFDWTGADPLS